MYLIRLLDIIWSILSWRNLRTFSRKSKLVWPITKCFLKQRRLQVALMSLAVALGFSAFLSFQVIVGQDLQNLQNRLEQSKLPSPVVIRQQTTIHTHQVAQLYTSHFLARSIHALEICSYTLGQQVRLMGFAPADAWWQSRVNLLEGDLNLGSTGVALPEHLATKLGVSVGQELSFFHVGNPGPVNRASLQVKAIFDSEYTLFDRPITLATSPIFAGYDIAAPHNIFVNCNIADVFRVRLHIDAVLGRRAAGDQAVSRPRYPWLVMDANTPMWVYDAQEPYSVLWQNNTSSSSAQTARRLLENNYRSGKTLILLVFFFSALCVFNILLISLLGRRREIGILKTIGYDEAAIFTTFLLEGGFIAGTGIVTGAIGSQIAFAIAANLTGYHLQASILQIVGAGLLSLVIYLLSAAIPADMARYTTVNDLLHERSLQSSLAEDPMASLYAKNRRQTTATGQ